MADEQPTAQGRDYRSLFRLANEAKRDHLRAYLRRWQGESASCVCGEINTRHCSVHGQGETTAARVADESILDILPPSGFLKENALFLADEHRARCDDPDCRVSLLGLWRLLEAAGFELTDDEKARLRPSSITWESA